MALTAAQITTCRELLSEHKAVLQQDGESAQSSRGNLVRFWPVIPESLHDDCMEFMRRWGSAKNQNAMTLSGVTYPDDMNGTYYDSGLAAHGCSIYLGDNYRIEMTLTGSQYAWIVVRIADDTTIFTSNSKSHAFNLADVESWTAPDEIVHEMTDDLEIGAYWLFAEEGVIEPISGTLSNTIVVPDNGIQYAGVTDPMVNHGKMREGTWRFGEFGIRRNFDKRYGNGTWAMVQELSLYLNSTAPITEEDTAWRLVEKRVNPQTGIVFYTLELPFCDPASIQSMSASVAGTSYAGTIYTINAGRISDTVYSIQKRPIINEQDGYGTIRWVLATAYSDELIFCYHPNPTMLVVDFYKLHALPADFSTVKSTYYFDASGNWYTSSDGSAILSMNGATYGGVETISSVQAYTFENTPNGWGKRISAPVPGEGEEGAIHIALIITTGYMEGDGYSENAFARTYIETYQGVVRVDRQVWMGGDQSYFNPTGSGTEDDPYVVPIGYTLEINNSPREDGLCNVSITVREAKRNIHAQITAADAGSGIFIREKSGYNVDDGDAFLAGTGDFDDLAITNPYLFDVGISAGINEFGLRTMRTTERND